MDERVPAAQQLIDTSYDFGRALQSDPLMRASVLMTTEGHGFDEERVSFDAWLKLVTDISAKAIAEGDIDDRWSALEVAQTLTAGVNGVQQSSRIYSDYADALDRLHSLWCMVAPGLFTPEAINKLTW